MAFQPIVDFEAGKLFAYEALVRGVNGESAFSVLSQANDENRYALDQQCRVKAIELGASLSLPDTGAYLSINFYPNAVYEPAACLRKTLETASRVGFPLDRLIFEVTEGEKVRDHEHLNHILREYRAQGFKTAIDDFGAGYAGLNLLAKFQPDILKIDAELTREIDKRPVSQTIVRAIQQVSEALNIQTIAEGIETPAELSALRDLGLRYFQGYHFARPGFESLPSCSDSGIA
ncbi:MAG: EAL domain-containing protein [Acidobacteria bacterium]|nr:EAL domain-containing protein [Acidobacteriota bacterium]MBW4043377.1 EAL domain-containing protein [Acidobacteriota bacterium]